MQNLTKIDKAVADLRMREKAGFRVGFWGTVRKTVRPMLAYQTCLYVCGVGVLWPNGWMDHDETWHAGRLRPWPHCLRWEPSSPSSKGTEPLNFRLISVVARWLDESRYHLEGR